jgi:hypothetical protein
MSKQVFTLEYPVRCSPNILYEFLSTPAGLQEWFAEKVMSVMVQFTGMDQQKKQNY